MPEAGKEVADLGEGTWQKRDCGTRKSQYRATHGIAPTPTKWQANSAYPSLGRPVRRPGSWNVMMALKRLKTGTRTAYRRHFYNQPFQSFTDIAPVKAGTLALSGLRRYISASFPDKACGSA
ncbi:MAG: hypothetical protein WA322_22855 [Pseudolabrys sp.]